MTFTLTAKHFAGGVTGGHTFHEEDEQRGLIAYCICGWVGPLRTHGGHNAFRAQSLRDYDRHISTCDVANRRKPAPDWGYIAHEPLPENEIVHSPRSWRAACACGWNGDLYWTDDAQARALEESTEHAKDRSPVHIGGRLL